MNIIDISHKLRPGKESRKLDLRILDAPEITGAPLEEEWYIMQEVTMVNHIGTHLEVPYHCIEDGFDLSEIPVDQFFGDGVLLDVRGHSSREPIPFKDVKSAAEDSGGIKGGDIVLLMTGWSQYYGTEEYLKPPFISREALIWLMNFGVKMFGLDTTGAMNPDSPDRYNHLPIFEAGTLYIENLTNLGKLPLHGFKVAAFPPAIEGLEGIPVRVVVFL